MLEPLGNLSEFAQRFKIEPHKLRECIMNEQNCRALRHSQDPIAEIARALAESVLWVARLILLTASLAASTSLAGQAFPNTSSIRATYWPRLHCSPARHRALY